MKRLFIIETFSSIQGEGLLAGTPAFFVRLAKCNLRCPWCDTKYSWTEGKEIEISSLASRVVEEGLPLTVITGGEPLLQQDAVRELIVKARELGYSGTFQIETNATIKPTALKGLEGVKITLSPKITQDYFAVSTSLLKEIIDEFEAMILEVKMVVRKSDLQNAKSIMKAIGEGIPVVLQPLHESGISYPRSSREVIEAVLKDEELRKRVRVIPQIHKLLGIL